MVSICRGDDKRISIGETRYVVRRAPALGNWTPQVFARAGKVPKRTATPSFQAGRTSGRSKKAPRLLQCGQNSFGGAAMKSAPGLSVLSDLALPCRIKSLEIGDDLFAYLRWISVAQCSDRNSKSVERRIPLALNALGVGPTKFPIHSRSNWKAQTTSGSKHRAGSDQSPPRQFSLTGRILSTDCVQRLDRHF